MLGWFPGAVRRGCLPGSHSQKKWRSGEQVCSLWSERLNSKAGGRGVPLGCQGSSPTLGSHVLGVQQCGRIDVSVISSALSNLGLLRDKTCFLYRALHFLVSPPWPSSVSMCLLTVLFKAVETFLSFSSSLQAPPTAHFRAAPHCQVPQSGCLFSLL